MEVAIVILGSLVIFLLIIILSKDNSKIKIKLLENKISTIATDLIVQSQQSEQKLLTIHQLNQENDKLRQELLKNQEDSQKLEKELLFSRENNKKLNQENYELNQKSKKLNPKIKEEQPGFVNDTPHRRGTLSDNCGFYQSDANDGEFYELDSEKLEINKSKNTPFPQEKPFQMLTDIQITTEYKKIVEHIISGKQFILITGGAGTGKTILIEHLNQLKLIDAVTAFTGIAALNCRGQTIHSLLQLPSETILPNEKLSKLNERKKRAIIENIKTLVIDEISMVRSDLIDAISRRFQEIKNNQLPFGGVQIIMIGDYYQLPPIVTANDRKLFLDSHTPEARLWKSQWFFDSHSLYFHKITHIELTKTFRQDESEIEYINHLNNCRKYENLNAAVNFFNEKCYNKPLDNAITLTTTNLQAQQINSIELLKIITQENKLKECKGIAIGEYAKIVRKLMNDSTLEDDPDGMKNLPAPYKLRLVIGAFVMILINDSQSMRYVNGSLGTVTQITNTAVTVKLLNGLTVDITTHKWIASRIDYDKKEKSLIKKNAGEFIQYPLILAWAVTTHKAQGRTLDNAFIDIGNQAFEAGQTYVALSRTRKLTDLSLSSRLSISDFRQDFRLNQWLNENNHFLLA